MLHADFYLLSEAQQAKWLLACRLLEKAYHQNHSVFVFCDHQQDAEYLDELLWTFKPESFIPHHLQGEGPEPPPAIQIGHTQEPRGFDDVFLNMSPTVPPFFTKFKRIIEIVPNDEEAKKIARAHFRIYRQAGVELKTHSI